MWRRWQSRLWRPSAADIEAFLAEPWKFDTTKTVNEALAAQIAVIGENMNIRRFVQVDGGQRVRSFLHAYGRKDRCSRRRSDRRGKRFAIKEMAKNVAMQVAALKPLYTKQTLK